MKWDDDEYKYEKYLILDAIIKLTEICKGNNFDSISIRDLNYFIDEFIEERKQTNLEI